MGRTWAEVRWSLKNFAPNLGRTSPELRSQVCPKPVLVAPPPPPPSPELRSQVCPKLGPKFAPRLPQTWLFLASPTPGLPQAWPHVCPKFAPNLAFSGFSNQPPGTLADFGPSLAPSLPQVCPKLGSFWPPSHSFPGPTQLGPKFGPNLPKLRSKFDQTWTCGILKVTILYCAAIPYEGVAHSQLFSYGSQIAPNSTQVWAKFGPRLDKLGLHFGTQVRPQV